MAFDHVGLRWQEHVVQHPDLLRPAEVEVLHGNPAKARRVLGWEPGVSLEQMVGEMIEADLARHKARMA
jgi:GDPmannose 4,6-dehydratase